MYVFIEKSTYLRCSILLVHDLAKSTRNIVAFSFGDLSSAREQLGNATIK